MQTPATLRRSIDAAAESGKGASSGLDGPKRLLAGCARHPPPGPLSTARESGRELLSAERGVRVVAASSCRVVGVPEHPLPVATAHGTAPPLEVCGALGVQFAAESPGLLH